jgi:uncharacterized membrane protein
MSGRRTGCRGGEGGQISLLIIGFAAILLALVAVVVDASQVVLLRRALASVADGAALAAAQSVAERPLYSGLARTSLPLDPAAARAAAVEHVSWVGGEARILAVDVRADTVTVVVAAQADLPLVGQVTEAFDGTTVTATASARSPIG